MEAGRQRWAEDGLRAAQVKIEPATGMKAKETVVSASDENMKKWLLVEDNQEFRTFLKEQ